MKTIRTTPASQQDNRSWWHYPEVWLVFAGPLVVIVACMATAVLAFQNEDVIMNDQHPPSLSDVQRKSLMPEQLAKAHAGAPFDIGLFYKNRQEALKRDQEATTNPSNSNTLTTTGAIHP
jgi:hypothetical protein